ncbi:MAG: AMP-dependent synthetase [Alphaproteobacteria bacterium]|nr:AMP-dependent synthetase [Alphaproteobacteria bacterium]|tara:strand:- start:571 stop:2109 length:1539 start_codon:yes stop_codon:yes gene_type:complete
MNLNQLLVRAAQSFPDRIALSHGTVDYCDYGTLARHASGLAGVMRGELGLAADDRVGLFMTNTPEYLEAFHGALHAGLTALPINNKLHEKELAYIIDDAGTGALFVTPDLAEKAAKGVEIAGSKARIVVVGEKEYAGFRDADPMEMVDRGDDDLAWLFYTSGTTGNPKGAMLSHRNLWEMMLTYFIDVDRVPVNGAALHPAPMSHGSGFYGIPHLAVGARQVVPESGGFEPQEIFDLFQHHEEVSLFAAPTMVKRLVGHSGGGDAANLRTVTYGGGPMYVADLKQALDRFGPKFVQIYGQGESPMCITVLPREDHVDTDHPRHEERLASVGYAQSVVQVKVADGDDRDLPVGEVGEILVHGAVVMRGYWNRPDVSAESLRGGWLHTGDMGAFDADGYLTLKDRSKDMIISGGSNIYPREIEEVLLRHPAVLECAVVGRPHPEWGEEVIAFVTPNEGEDIDTAELDRMCLENIARFKRPKEYRVAGSLPKNNYGKIVKRELRNQLETEGSADG